MNGHNGGKNRQESLRVGRIIMELTEKQKNCPYCHPGSNLKNHYGGSAWINSELEFDMIKGDPSIISDGECCYGDISFNPQAGWLESLGDGAEPLVIHIHYCPMCGRPLGEEESND